jgi:hypothetical protein
MEIFMKNVRHLLFILPLSLVAQPPTELTVQTPLPPSPVASVSVVGNPGNNAYAYYVIANYPAGASVSVPVIATRVPATLSASNYVNVGWQALAGVTTYDVVRVTPPNVFTGSCTCAVATGLTTTSAKDIGAALSSYTESASTGVAKGSLYVDNLNYYPNLWRQIVNGVTLPMGDISNVQRWGVIANGPLDGTGGTSQSVSIQAAVDAASTLAGGMSATVTFPSADLAYVVGDTVNIPSNVTVDVQPGAVVQKMHGTLGPVFAFGDGSSAVSNIWVVGGGTIDGNRNNISISGDGGNMGIRSNGCTDCGTRDITVKNAATGNVYVTCWGPSVNNLGDNFQILNSTLMNSRRNNLEVICGTNTIMRGGALKNATGGSLSGGVDVEPNGAGQFITGFTLDGVEVSGNRDVGILIKDTYDESAVINLINVNCHDNASDVASGECLSSTNFHSAGLDGSIFNVIGGSYIQTGATSTAAVAIQNYAVTNIVGATITGTNRGLLSCGSCGPTVKKDLITNITGSVLSGTVTRDIDTQNHVNMSATTLVHGTCSFCQYITGAEDSQVVSVSSTYGVTATDFMRGHVLAVPSGTFTMTLPINTVMPWNGQAVTVLNYGSGVVTIARNGQNINGGTASITLAAGSATAPTSATVWSNGTDYFARLGN